MLQVITLGTFDLLHAGHVDLLRWCKGLGEVTVGLNTDEFILKYKKKLPIMSYDERKEMLLAIGLVDKVIPNGQETGSAKQVILESGAKTIVIGSDWARKDYVGQLGIDWDWLEENGIGIFYIPRQRKMSSTEVKRRIGAT